MTALPEIPATDINFPTSNEMVCFFLHFWIVHVILEDILVVSLYLSAAVSEILDFYKKNSIYIMILKLSTVPVFKAKKLKLRLWVEEILTFILQFLELVHYVQGVQNLIFLWCNFRPLKLDVFIYDALIFFPYSEAELNSAPSCISIPYTYCS
jgi:hypothetical protein